MNNQAEFNQREYHHQILEAVAFIRARYIEKVDLAIISGTGLGKAMPKPSNSTILSFDKIPYLSPTSVKSHVGQLELGKVDDLNVAVISGRLHYYEGHPIHEVTRMVRILQFLGVPKMIFLNAVGGLRDDLRPGDVVAVRDHLFMIPENPLRGLQQPHWGESFPDPKHVYQKGLERIQRTIPELKEPGVYVCLPGPQLETMAELRLWKRNGADLVGMSTIPEVLVCQQAGVETTVLSTVTNIFPEGHIEEVTIQDVVEAAERAVPQLRSYLRRLIQSLSEEKPD